MENSAVIKLPVEPEEKKYDDEKLSTLEAKRVVGKCPICLMLVARHGAKIRPNQVLMKAGLFGQLPEKLCPSDNCRQRHEEFQEMWEEFQRIKKLPK